MQINADILALQEVDNGVLRSKRAHLARAVAEAAGMEVVFAPTQKFMVGQYGNALLVRGTVSDVQIVELRGRARFNTHAFGRDVGFGFEGRNAVIATAEVGNLSLSVATTHLSTQDKVLNTWQLGQAAARLATRSNPRILLGDFNRTPADATPIIEQYELELIPAPATYPAAKPVRKIDHIAVSSEVQIVHSEAVKLPISDHRALIADIQINNQ